MHPRNDTATGRGPSVLAAGDWTARRTRHLDRVARIVEPYQERKAAGTPHPVHDFLFTYYSFRPNQLRRWHPGFGTALAGPGSGDYLRYTGYRSVTVDGDSVVTVDPAVLEHRRSTVEFVAGLLAATEARTPRLNCFGLHEWAMVYRGGAEAIRHQRVPLRLGFDGTDAVVESMPLRCTHYDAFRFFTPAAAPRNETALDRDSQIRREQPGCLHAGMDVYKWAYKLAPLVDSDLVMDCFEHALAARELDMQASPYDLSGYGYDPVRIETPSGRAEYVRRQQQLAERATPLRTGLLERCRQLLS
ncbi:3-methyladenine DNA glycosylase [Rhodococcus tibetensis]|uniref:3-methyladenine DNA glycosylase n=1 Tax=Rhodococcus tibetensis TaxID=2965064 RepID=A0ABT1Q895_9NOCA|nr:3-methyladenine DNA glycosylase [Rhodococcus sp. FXJ9.536]MCQ4118476.1 3-methyladenine DNA glycosylase [Rhodococcus sp. FXJ9.536]